MKDFINQLQYALILVSLVVIVITFNLSVSLIIVFGVILVILYVLAIIYFWDLKLNMSSSMHVIFALGISVDYSVHIAHKYLVTKTPDRLETN